MPLLCKGNAPPCGERFAPTLRSKGPKIDGKTGFGNAVLGVLEQPDRAMISSMGGKAACAFVGGDLPPPARGSLINNESLRVCHRPSIAG